MKYLNHNIKDHAKQGGYARSNSLSPSRRKEIASLAASKRWERKHHVCDYTCRCTCGVRMQKHSKFSECKTPACEKII